MNHNPNTRDKLAILLNDVEMFGLRQSLRHAVAYLLSNPRDNFDRRHGVLTVGAIAPSEKEISDPASFESALAYQPTNEAVMRHILRYVSANFDPRTLTFVDLGCGRGRALLLAAELPFLEVLGVEISEAHCLIAEANISNYRANPGKALRGGTRQRTVLRSKIRVHRADVTAFNFPETDLLVYLFNPFRGAVLRSTLDRLAQFQARTKRRVHVVLSNPQAEGQFRVHPAFLKQHEFQVISVGASWNLWRCEASAPERA